MFTKRETRTGKAYAYRMVPSLKMLVTYTYFFIFTPGNCSLKNFKI